MVRSARRSITRRGAGLVQSWAQLHKSQRGVARLRIAQPIRYVGGEMGISIATAASLEVEQDERLTRAFIVTGLLALMLTPIVPFCTALVIQITGAIAPVNRSAS